MASISLFEEAYKKLNQHYFEGKLPNDVTIYLTERRIINNAIKVTEVGNEKHYEMPISINTLYKGNAEILANMVHMMVHIWCSENGLQDTSNGGRYHNMVFKEEAEKRELFVQERAASAGYENTYPSDEMKKTLKELGLLDIDLSAQGDEKKEPWEIKKIKPKSYTRKYVCMNCGDRVRSTKEVDITCNKCGIPMVLEV